MVRLWVVLVAMAIQLFAAGPASAQAPQRFALLIGNQGYHPSVGALKNPHNDIAVVGAALSKQGFTVLPPVREARRSQILGAVRGLVARLNTAGEGAVGFIYYSGHGAAEKDTNINYLIPVDATEPGSSTFWDDSLKLDDVLKLLEGARNAAKFIVFDACRNELQLPERTSDKGLIPVREHQGMFIAYATAPGRVASDRGASSGPYAAALAAELGKPGLDHLGLFQNVKEAVFSSTGGVQQPWNNDGLVRRVYLTGLPQTVVPEPPAKPAPAIITAEAERAWDRIKDSKSVPVLTAFTKQFPGTVYAALAGDRIGDLQRVAMLQKQEEETRRSPERSVRPGQPFKDVLANGQPCTVCPEMVVVPKGEYLMGSTSEEIASATKQYPAGAEWFKWEAPRMKVTIPQAFAVGKSHITRGQFAAFVEATGHKAEGGCFGTADGKEYTMEAKWSWRSPGYEQNDSHPVVCVNWHDASSFIKWLAEQTGKPYRLMSEAEAEYVARGTTTANSQTRYFFGNDPNALCAHSNGADQTMKAKDPIVSPCSDGYVYTAPVKSFKPNPFGLHDVHGNAYSWTQDCWNESNTGNPGDGTARSTGRCDIRVFRGGSWVDPPVSMRSSFRSRSSIDQRLIYISFRVARAIAP